MRNTARWATIIGLAVTAVCGPFTGAALAAPASTPGLLYAPSALVLTVGHGEQAAVAAAERAVTLNCSPVPSGSHPEPAPACAELRAAGADFNMLTATGNVMCTQEYKPVVVTATGVWQGKRISYEHTFANECLKNAATTSVFAF